MDSAFLSPLPSGASATIPQSQTSSSFSCPVCARKQLVSGSQASKRWQFFNSFVRSSRFLRVPAVRTSFSFDFMPQVVASDSPSDENVNGADGTDGTEQQETGRGTRTYLCVDCGWIYDEAQYDIKFEDQPDEFKCPKCQSKKFRFEEVGQCPACGGAKKIPCGTCAGDGKVQRSGMKMPWEKQAKTFTTTCNTCRGSGFQVCMACKGEGIVPVKTEPATVS
mmetsp:Transcript_12815/g.22087  ORF Transcript_12815/g.22087 Transcript_12815/m.22087 type:complete len:222 (-) Transcript_12815:214-879(-)|eukprot:CAMPEP_0196652418 /NCGR_PEP_ID=MMETSP1086-20130531/1702_1 /TAXON_ID=77921 /ORGANISM="Cyanoptyche  gloeocystis , Strain SAG4.97" /LENGTH=221 /DNA_ID=CAMNT_0041982951 /DNA_START=108 /DNA_END=773 /DNA_ORIENTATION=-